MIRLEESHHVEVMIYEVASDLPDDIKPLATVLQRMRELRRKEVKGEIESAKNIDYNKVNEIHEMYKEWGLF